MLNAGYNARPRLWQSTPVDAVVCDVSTYRNRHAFHIFIELCARLIWPTHLNHRHNVSGSQL